MAFVAVDSGNFRDNVLIGTLNINAPLPDPLRPHVAYEAMHDSGEVDAQGDCHPGTRIAIQKVIKRWADDPHPNTLVNLMIGAAGAGKSAIMRTIAKVLEQEGKLLGGFFCFRSSPRRSDGSLVIPTLVAQMIKRIPHLRALVYQAFEEDEGLLTKAMDIQALKLIIEPLNSVDLNERPQWPYVVFLDGLDEVKGIAAQQAIVRVFAYINRHLVSPLHFFVANRPEPPILQAFDDFMGDRWSQLELDDSFRPNDDIDIFYIDHFQKICDRNPHLPLGWPGVPIRRMLVGKGSGKFIFASVVVAVVGDPSSTRSPQERLDLILEVTKGDDLRPLERLDLLYVTVLNQIPVADRPQVLRILSLVLAAGNTLEYLSPTPRFLDALFCMTSGTTRHRISNLHSILTIPARDGKRISPQHVTLGDFIFDKARSEQFGFHVDKTQLVEDTVLQIAAALQSNPDEMADALDDFVDFFAGHHKSSLNLKLVQNLQSYQLTALSPLALLVYAVPLALRIRSSPKSLRFRILSRSIMNEAHRRARRYCNNYGILGVRLLACSAMYVFSKKIRGISSRILRDGITALWPQLKESAILLMDRTSGLSLMTCVDLDDAKADRWCKVLHRSGSSSSYLHLVTRPDVMVHLSHLKWSADRSSHLGSEWLWCLPFDRSTVSSLRASISFARSEPDDEYFNTFILNIKRYMTRHWEKRWRVPSLYLLRRDWYKWKEEYDRVNTTSE